jgi:ribosomal protein S18 acetylase RimI-like enzyme
MVHLNPMTESEFQAYTKGAVEELARERVREGDWQPADALHKAEQEFLRMLPQGVHTQNQYLLSIQADQTDLNVGMLWFALRGTAPHLAAFIYDFLISEQFRQRGYGTQALSALDEKAKELGVDTIALHVFGHNQAAIALYQKAGYAITNLQMAKKLNS